MIGEELERLRAEVARLRAHAERHAAEKHAELDAEERAAQDAHSRALGEWEDQAEADRRRHRQDHDARTQRAMDELNRLVERRRPTVSSGRTPPPSELVEIGEVAVGSRTAPLLVPFLESPGLVLAADPGSEGAEIELLRRLICRVVEEVPLPHLRIDVFDPAVMMPLAAFGRLRSKRADAFPQPMTARDQLSRCLDSLAAHAQATAEHLARAGARTLSERWASTGSPEGEFRVLVLLGFPEQMTQEYARRLQVLTGRPGIFIVLVEDPQGLPSDRDFDPSALLERLQRVTVSDGRIRLAGVPDSPLLRSLPALDEAEVSRIIEAAFHDDASGVSSGPVVSLAELVGADAREPWQQDAADGLEAVIGRIGADELVLRLRSENPPMPNVLVGGAVGQGKSNLLLDIVYSLAARYSPEDLQLLLLDFKQGIEFNRFNADAEGSNWLPHALLIGLESSRAFGIAVLKHLLDELEERSIRFKARGVSSYDEFRRNGETLPRLVLIIDEFQMLFDGDDDLTTHAVDLLAKIARLGRAAGIHLVLASQTLSGIRGFMSRGDSIFGQFASRLALRNTATESETILSSGNRAAAELTYRGEVILNENFGGDPARNQRGMSAYAEAEFVAELQRELWKRAGGEQAPRPHVFRAADPTPWMLHGQLPERPAGSPVAVDLGRAVSVLERPVVWAFDESTDRTLAIIGPDRRVAEGLLAAIVRSASTQRPEEPIIALDCESPEGAPEPAWLAQCVRLLGDRGTPVERIGRSEAGSFLVERAPTLSKATVLVLGPQLIPAFEEYVYDENTATSASPQERLVELLSRGGLRGVRTIGQWPSYDAATKTTDYQQSPVGAYALAGVSNREIQDATGSFTVARPEESPRFLFAVRHSAEDPLVAVPFPSAAETEAEMQAAARKEDRR